MRLLLLLAATSTALSQIPAAERPLVPESLRSRWADDMRTKNLDEILSLYDAGAVFIRPDAPPISTASDLRKLYETIFSTYDSTITLNTPHHHDTGTPYNPTNTIDEGTYRETLSNRTTGLTATLCGHYTFTYIKASNGAIGWRISRMEWTTTPCPTP